MNKLKQKILDLCDKEGKQKQTMIWLLTIANLLGMVGISVIISILFIFVFILFMLYPIIGIVLIALFFLAKEAISMKPYIEKQINEDLQEKKKSESKE